MLGKIELWTHALSDNSVTILHHGSGKFSTVFMHEDVSQDIEL
jgi:hypothetical protein